MNRRFLAVLLVFCGFTVTEAGAKPRLVADEIQGVTTDWKLDLKQAGPAVLAGIVPLGAASLAPQPVEIKVLGRDRYGNAQLIVYRAGRPDSVQEELLAAGQALTFDRAATPKAWIAAERWAERNKKGVWAARDFILSPQNAGDHVGEFRLLQGRVTRSFKSRDTYYLNFGEDWKTDVSLRIPRRAWRSFGKHFTIADGSCVRARGAIFLANGPMIELTRPEQLEIIPCVAP